MAAATDASLPDNITVAAAPVFGGPEVPIRGAVIVRAEPPPALTHAFDELRGDRLRALMIAIVIGVLVGFLASSLIAIRIRRLARLAEQMAAGDFDARLPRGGGDEIGDLTRSLDTMRQELRETFGMLATERDRLSAVFDGLTEAVIVAGEDGQVRFTNPAASRLVRDGRPAPALVPSLRRAAEHGADEIPVLSIDGRLYGVQARQVPAEHAVLVVVRDRTEELKREQAEAEFVSNAAHELRNPLAGIMSGIEVLRGGAKDDPDARDRFLDRLAYDAERMTRLTQSLLTLARVEAAAERDPAEVVDVTLAADEAMEAVESAEGVELRDEVEPDLVAEGDPVLLRQVMLGLLSNACAYTPAPGTVTLRASRGAGEHRDDRGKGHREGNPDRGAGSSLRSLLSGVRHARRRGLRARSLDREANGERDGRRDRPEFRARGGEHLLGAPARCQADPHPSGMNPTPPAENRILVVDDELSVRESVGYALEQEGFQVTLAANGEEAEGQITDDNFDLLILDIMMPGKSGLDLCREVRAHSPVPIILLTAKDAEVDKVVGLEVGADDYVTKPFSVRELLGRVRAQLRRRELDRSDGTAESAEIKAGPVSIDLARHLVTVRGEPTNLTRSEFQVLRLLAGSPGQVFSRKQIMEELWQTEFRGDVRACDVHISNLRQKVERDPQNPELVAHRAPGRLPLRRGFPARPAVTAQEARGHAGDRRGSVPQAGAAAGEDGDRDPALALSQQRSLVDAPAVVVARTNPP